ATVDHNWILDTLPGRDPPLTYPTPDGPHAINCCARPPAPGPGGRGGRPDREPFGNSGRRLAGRPRSAPRLPPGPRGPGLPAGAAYEGRRRHGPRPDLERPRRGRPPRPCQGGQRPRIEGGRAGDAVRLQGVRGEAEGRPQPVDLAPRRRRRTGPRERPTVGEP